jgi:hypothetical protein
MAPAALRSLATEEQIMLELDGEPTISGRNVASSDNVEVYVTYSERFLAINVITLKLT